MSLHIIFQIVTQNIFLNKPSNQPDIHSSAYGTTLLTRIAMRNSTVSVSALRARSRVLTISAESTKIDNVHDWLVIIFNRSGRLLLRKYDTEMVLKIMLIDGDYTGGI